MRVAIATDHAGADLLKTTLDAVAAAGHEAVVIGQATEGDDYPDVALAVGGAIRTGQAQRGILLCGSGAGVTVAANKIPLVRAALAYETYTARQMVQHDDVNVLALGARVIGPAVAADVVEAFVGAEFSGVERHARRLSKVLAIEATRVQGAAADLVGREQRLWLDGIDAAVLDDGRLAHWIGDHAMSGVATAPEHLAAHLRAGDYRDRLSDQHAGGIEDPEALVLALLLADACAAADLLGGVHAATGGMDGYAAVDLPPRLVDDVDGTLEVARRLNALGGRSNIMVKVPATRAGQVAVRRLVEAGVPVAVTLVHSAEQYLAAEQAYADGVRLRLRAGADPAVAVVIVAHVAPWDHATAERLPEDLHGTVGLHVARGIVAGAREQGGDWLALVGEGGLPPRLAFAGLTASDPLPATHYVDTLDADGVTLLLAPPTLEALDVAGHVTDRTRDAAADPSRFADAGVALDALATRLQHDALRRAAAAWDDLLAALDAAVGVVDGAART